MPVAGERHQPDVSEEDKWQRMAISGLVESALVLLAEEYGALDSNGVSLGIKPRRVYPLLASEWPTA